jgi:integrase
VQAGEHLSRPGLSLKANGYHFYDVLKAAGVTRSASGVTAHGLRHQGANDRYEELAGTASPVRGGEPVDRQVDQAARTKVALVLGHSRELITRTYLGQSLVMRSQPVQDKDVVCPSEADADEVGGST